MKTIPLFLSSLLASGVLMAAPAPLTIRVVPEREVILNSGSREVLLEIELEGRPGEKSARAPMNLAIVLDHSGSMGGAKIEKARQAACAAVDKMGEDDYISMVVYDDTPEVLFPPQRVSSKRDREALKETINHIYPGGGTAIFAGVTLGSAQLQKHSGARFVNRIILLSDGLANVGPSSTRDLSRLGARLSKDGQSVSTIGLGDDYNEDLMTALAEAGQANYYYVKDAEKLPGIFAEELGAARTKLARGVTIRISAPDGVEIHEILGHPEIKCEERSAEITLPEFFGSEKRRYLARCTVREPQSEPLAVASVVLKYETADTGKTESDTKDATVRFTDHAADSDKSLQAEVAREASILKNREAKELAVKLADEGKSKDAAMVLSRQAAINAAAPAKAQIPNLEKENQSLTAGAKELNDSGSFSKRTRKQTQLENWQDKYQKR